MVIDGPMCVLERLCPEAAKLDCRRIMEHTARGRADAKARGVRFGRKPILTPHQ
jgi:hypothetical protein